MVIFIVDSSQKVRATDRQQVSVLRECGNPRLAVIYSKDGKDRHDEDWDHLLKRDFNIRLRFNAHNAGVHERLRLLDKIKAMFPEWEQQKESAIKILWAEHLRKRREAVEHLLDMLRIILKLRKSRQLGESTDHDVIRKKLDGEIRDAVRDEEKRFREKARKTFGHSEEYWSMGDLLTEDVFAENVWKVLGLTQYQLVVVGATTGAIIGLGCDLSLAGLSLGVGTAIGTVSGAAGAYFGAERVAMVEIPKVGFLPEWWGGRKLGGVDAVARVDPKSALLGILIDRGMLYLEQLVDRPHGLDDKTLVEIAAPAPVAPQGGSGGGLSGPTRAESGERNPASDRPGLVTTWSKDERNKVLAQFLGQAGADNRDPIKLDEAKGELKKVILKQFEILLSGDPGPGETTSDSD